MMYYSSRFGVDWYTHNVKGGKYWIENTSRKIQIDGVWVKAITYSDADRNEYVRSLAEFNDKFTKETSESNKQIQEASKKIDEIFQKMSADGYEPMDMGALLNGNSLYELNEENV